MLWGVTVLKSSAVTIGTINLHIIGYLKNANTASITHSDAWQRESLRVCFAVYEHWKVNLCTCVFFLHW